MDNQLLNAAIVVISQTAHQEPSSDRSGPALKEEFGNDTSWNVSHYSIVPDDVALIERKIIDLTDGTDYPNVIVTSGGTGFAVKDITPEAVSPLIHRHAPGLVHGMLAASLQVTPFAMVSRPVAGVRNKTVIVTLPGSPKGARENLQSIIKLLPHACRQAAGEDSRTMHAGGIQKLEKDAGLKGAVGSGSSAAHKHSLSNHMHNHHHHGHGHAIPTAHTDPSSRPQSNDPLLGPSARNRHSPYPMLSVEEALASISTNIPALNAITRVLDPSIINHTLAADVHAAESVPAFRASIVDGYAIRTASDTNRSSKAVFKVAFAAHAQAGKDEPSALQDGQIARITTGAPVPEGADAVVMVEDTVVVSRSADDKEEVTVEILTDQVKAGENVRAIGSDVKQGDLVMRANEGISALGGEFGLLASVGVREVSVYRRPVVGVLSTGDEIVAHDEKRALKMGEVRDTNRPTLLASVRHHGFEAVDLGIVEDKQDSLESRLRTALLSDDVLITTGGVSMGELDLLKPTVERGLGGTIHFGRVAMKPGKPTTFATVPAVNLKDPTTGLRGGDDASAAIKESKKVIFSLPGNPASATVTFLLFALPALRAMSGIKPAGLPLIKVRLEHDMHCDAAREEFHRVVVGARVTHGPADAALWASSTGGQRSSRVGSFRGANALVRLPKGGGKLDKESVVDAFLIGDVVGLH